MSYLRFSGRLTLQVGGLSGLGAVGNYNQVAVARVLHYGRAYDVPVLTGNAFKHWHAVYLAETYQSLGGKLLNELCRAGVGYRGFKVESTLSKLEEDGDKYVAGNECEAIRDLCNDVHGFLIARGQRSDKRDSLVKFSFVVPVLERENLEEVAKFAVQHNRVVPAPVREAMEEREAMMVYKQEYASGVFGFSIRMDLANVLRPTFTNCNVELDGDLEAEAAMRRKAAVLALQHLLLGSGSRQSRALPVARLEELAVAVSSRPIPNLVHGAYPNWLEDSLDVLSAYAAGLSNAKVHVLYYGGRNVKGAEGVEYRRFDRLSDLFKELLGLVEKA